MLAKTNDGKTVPPDITNVNAGRVAPTLDDAITTEQDRSYSTINIR